MGSPLLLALVDASAFGCAFGLTATVVASVVFGTVTVDCPVVARVCVGLGAGVVDTGGATGALDVAGLVTGSAAGATACRTTAVFVGAGCVPGVSLPVSA